MRLLGNKRIRGDRYLLKDKTLPMALYLFFAPLFVNLLYWFFNNFAVR